MGGHALAAGGFRLLRRASVARVSTARSLDTMVPTRRREAVCAPRLRSHPDARVVYDTVAVTSGRTVAILGSGGSDEAWMACGGCGVGGRVWR